MKTFADRLVACQVRGDLTVADLATLLGRSYPTVRSWFTRETRAPYGPAGREVSELLDHLKQAIDARDGLPVPSTLSHRDRVAYVAKLAKKLGGRHARGAGRVSSARATR